MGQFIQVLLDNLYKLWPIRIIDGDAQGVLYVPWGKNRMRLLQPGVHWFFPGLMKVDEAYTTIRSIDCGVQTVETSDGQAVSLSVNVEVRVTDAARLFSEYCDWQATLVNIVRGHVSTHLSRHTYAELRGDDQAVLLTLLRALRLVFQGSGLKIRGVLPDELGRSKMYRLIGNPPMAID